MIQSGVLRIFRMAVRGVCSLSASSLCFVSLLVRPALSALSALSCSVCSVLLCPALSARPSARLSIRSAVSPPVHLFHLFCPLVQPSVCPFVRLFRLLFICSVCSSIRLLCLSVSPLIRPRPLCPLCPLCLSAPSVYLPVPLRSRRILFRRFRQVLCFFFCGMIFPCPISDTLLKSRRGELGISDNNSYLWMQKMSFAHKNTTGYNEKS